MQRSANTLSKIAIFFAVVALILALLVHLSGTVIFNITHWGFAATGISLLLLAIALNSLGLTEPNQE